MQTEKMPNSRTDEMRVRKAARRQGLSLRSSRRRDPNALDYGVWRLLTARGRVVVRGDLAMIEEWLRKPREAR